MTLYVDRILVDRLLPALQRQDVSQDRGRSAQHYWSTPPRPQDSPLRDVLEVRLRGDRLVNYAHFRVPHFPHTAEFQVYLDETWTTVLTHHVRASKPETFGTHTTSVLKSHPQHTGDEHWLKVSGRFVPQVTSRVRVVLWRSDGIAPKDTSGRDAPYSLGLRDFDIGYRVTSRSDVPEELADDLSFASSTDIMGGRISYHLYEESADRVLGDGGWRCEPQPVSYAVVALYLDLRDGQGDSQIVDRFYLDPTHPGPHLNLYWSEDEPESAGAYDTLVWHPIPRDYRVEKGVIAVPTTRARYWKFEFTNLAAEQTEAFLPTSRTVQVFPPDIVARWLSRTMANRSEPGTRVQSNMQRLLRYSDMLLDVPPDEEAVPRQSLSPTEVLYAGDVAAALAIRGVSWMYGFEPWHQPDSSPRFHQVGKHTYQTITIDHERKVAFLCGLRSVEAYRLNYEVADDTEVYVEHFDDARNLSQNNWWVRPNRLSSEGNVGVRATSKVMESAHDVIAVQFATQQTPPVQIAPDDDFRDPFLAVNVWNDPGRWHAVGADVTLSYLPDSHSIHFERTSPDLEAVPDSEDWAGIESVLIQPSEHGRVYAAARVTADHDLTHPLWVQIVAQDGTVLAEDATRVTKGQTVEWWVGYTLRSAVARARGSSGLVEEPVHVVPTDSEFEGELGPLLDDHVRIRVVQKEPSHDEWVLDTLSLFEDTIVWEFSADGGTSWVAAEGVRNNPYGVVWMPVAGKEFRWRVTGWRPNLHVTSLQVRPWYVGQMSGKSSRPRRGPNLSTYDQFPPINDDPEWKDWPRPIPRWWFADWRMEGAVPLNFIRIRSVQEHLPLVIDVATRLGIFYRSAVDSAPADDEVTYERTPGGTVYDVPHPLPPDREEDA